MVFRPGLLKDVFRDKAVQGLAQQGEHAQGSAVKAGRLETFRLQMAFDEPDMLQFRRVQHAAALVILPGVDAQDGFGRKVVVQNGVQRGAGRAWQMQKKERFIHGVFSGAAFYTPFRGRSASGRPRTCLRRMNPAYFLL